MDYSKPIQSASDAIAFIFALHDAGKLFHFDNSPENIVNFKTGENLFTPEEIPHVRQRVEELFWHLDDPFELAVTLIKYPEFFEMDFDELDARLDVYWQVTIPNFEHAQNVAAMDAARDEAAALDLAIKVMKGEYK